MGKKKGKDAEEPADLSGPQPISIAGHPRASRSIARARAWAAMFGFGMAAWLGYKSGLVFVDLVIRSIVIGVIASLAVWAAAQTIWKQLIYAELAAARREALANQKAILDEIMNAESVDVG